MNAYEYMKNSTLAEIINDMIEEITDGSVDLTHARIARAAYAALVDNLGREDAHRLLGFDPTESHLEPLPEPGDFIHFELPNEVVSGLVMRSTYDPDEDALYLRIQTHPDDETYSRHKIHCSGPDKVGYSLS